MDPFTRAHFILHPKPSARMIYGKGERWMPCLKILEGSNLL
jgi:hypothetical protein